MRVLGFRFICSRLSLGICASGFCCRLVLSTGAVCRRCAVLLVVMVMVMVMVVVVVLLFAAVHCGCLRLLFTEPLSRSEVTVSNVSLCDCWLILPVLHPAMCIFFSDLTRGLHPTLAHGDVEGRRSFPHCPDAPLRSN